MKSCISALLGAFLLWFTACLSLPVEAQILDSTPSISLLVGYAPGGVADRVTRMVGKYMGAELGLTVKVKNLSGAGGLIAAHAALQAGENEPTLLLADSALIVAYLNAAPGAQDPQAFFPVGTVAAARLAVVSGQMLSQNLDGWRSQLKTHPQSISIGVPGVHTVHEFVAQQFLQKLEIQGVLVPYRGGLDMLGDLTEQRLSLGVLSLPTALELEKAKRVRVLAVTGYSGGAAKGNVYQLPGQHVNLEGASTVYLLAAPSLSKQLQQQVVQAWQRIMSKPSFAQELLNLGMEPRLLDSAKTREQLLKDAQTMRKVFGF